MDTNFAYGEVPATLRDKYREGHDLIIQAWTRPEPFSFNGKYTQLRYVNIWPRPLQKPHPPVWIPGGGSIETWDWVLDHDYCYCYLSYFGFIRGSKVLQGFWQRCDARGIERNPYRSGFLQLVAVAETDAAAERDYYTHADYFYNKCLHVFEGFADAPGYRTQETLRSGFAPQVGDRPSRMRSQLSWKDLLDQGYVIGGSPATVRERLEYAIKELHTGHLMVLCQFGSMPPELARQNTELFAKEVAPHVRPLYNEWEDRWWPQSLLQTAPFGSTSRV